MKNDRGESSHTRLTHTCVRYVHSRKEASDIRERGVGERLEKKLQAASHRIGFGGNIAKVEEVQ